MLLPVLAAKTTPSCTSGVVRLGPGASVCDHTSLKLETLAAVICVSGLKPRPSCVRRHVNQSPGAGFLNISSVTGVKCCAGSSAFGHGGSFTFTAKGPPDEERTPGNCMRSGDS